MRELVFRVTLEDCTVQTVRAGGKGGQNQNKRDTGVRIIHPPSGAVGESRDGRDQLSNKKQAFFRMASTEKFRRWARLTALGIPSIEERVEEQMQEKDLFIEYAQDGKWVEVARS